MPGHLRISYDVWGDDLVEHNLLGIGDRLENAEPAFHEIADDLRNMERHLFATEDSWAPLAESTLAYKRRRGLSSKILQATTEMRRSLTEKRHGGGFEIVTPDSLYFGTSISYAHFHKTGTRNMPKRDPLIVEEADRRRWSKLIQRYAIEGTRATYGLPEFGVGLTQPFGL